MIDKAKHEDLEAIYKLVCTLEKTQINKERFVRLYNESLTKIGRASCRKRVYENV